MPDLVTGPGPASVASSSRGSRLARGDTFEVQRRDETLTSRWHRPATAVLLALSSAWTGSLPVGAQDARAPAAPRTLTERIDHAMDDLAEGLLWDAEAARAWVAAEVTPEPYAGVMKGPHATYLTRAGNDADRTLLLAALLDRSLIPHRFASCELAASDRSPGEASGRAGLVIDDLDAVLAEVDDPSLHDEIMRADDLRRRHAERVRAAVPHLETLLSDARAEIDPEAPARRPASGTIRHVWVQMAAGAQWRDLDLGSPDGSPPCEPSETWSRLPDELLHRVRLVLTVEHRVDGELVRSEPLVVDRPLADLATAAIVVTFGEASGLLERDAGSGSALGGVEPDELLAYTPLALIDGEMTTGAPIEVPPPSGALVGAGDEIREISEELFGGAEGEQVLEPRPVTGAWLAIELAPPHGDAVVLESEVFDRIGAEARLRGRASTAAIGPLTERHGELVELSALWHVHILVGAVQAPVLDYAVALDPREPSGLAARLDAAARLFPALQHDLGGRAAMPVVLLAGLEETVDETGRFGSRLILDMLHVPAGPIHGTAAAAADAVASVAAESLLASLLGDEGSLDAGDSWDVLEVARLAGIPFVSYGPGDLPAVSGASAEAHARMEDRLAAGLHLLTPSRVPAIDGIERTAWWLIDPVSGVVRDEHEDGRHQQLTEERIAQEPGRRARRPLHEHWACRLVLRAVGSSMLVLFLATGGTDPSSLAGIKGGGLMSLDSRERQRRTEKAVEAACRGRGS